MRKLVTLGLLLLVFRLGAANPLPVKLDHTIIVDTDCAIDDVRALSFLLARPQITIKAILLSDGSLSPVEGFSKVKAVLHEFNRDTIPVGVGKTNKEINPPWRAFVQQVKWGRETILSEPSLNAAQLLSDVLKDSDEKITLVCMGSLGNIADALTNDKTLRLKIERVVWYTESASPLQGFNYEADKASADVVFNSGIRLDVISNLGKDGSVLDMGYFQTCRQSDTPLSSFLHFVNEQPLVYERLQQQHFRLCDDLVPLYITNPELFDMNTLKDNIKVRYNQDYSVESVKEAMADMIKGTYVASNSIVFNEFPRKRELFAYDVRLIMDSAIARHGLDEWKANVITDEFHGHLGVFSIVGAKMGIRAREIFDAHPDELKVVSFAGSKPPYSCLNDGIQVSTGATLGMGTITIAADPVLKPSAIFTLGNRSVQITLKKEYLDQVNADISEGIVKFGLSDDGYWKLIRKNALKYWVEWDRNDIFDISYLE